MLRYFYIIVCIQISFCYDFTEGLNGSNQGRRVKRKFNILRKKHAKTSKPNQSVQFDVDNFMKNSKETSPSAFNEPYYGYRASNEAIGARRAPNLFNDYGSFDENYSIDKERNEQNAINSQYDDNLAELQPHMESKDSTDLPNFNTNPEKYANYNEKSSKFRHRKSSNRQKHSDNQNSDTKCAYKSMKFPFFSFNKSSNKNKNLRNPLFCFNCHEQTNKKEKVVFNTSDEYNRLRKRAAYRNLCPKCIREMLSNLKKTSPTTLVTTKQYCKDPIDNPKSTVIANKKTRVNNEEVLDNSQYLYYLRRKRTDDEDRERERRLKEIEEVERKIENVHIALPPRRFDKGANMYGVNTKI